MSELLEKAQEIANELNTKFENALNSYANNADEMCAKYDKQCEIADNFLALIRKYNPQWIPISEGVPEKDGEYIITAKAKHNGEIYVTNCSYYSRQWKYAHRVDVLAWMALPLPYFPQEG